MLFPAFANRWCASQQSATAGADANADVRSRNNGLPARMEPMCLDVLHTCSVYPVRYDSSSVCRVQDSNPNVTIRLRSPLP